jgi:hypothetical protein
MNQISPMVEAVPAGPSPSVDARAVPGELRRLADRVEKVVQHLAEPPSIELHVTRLEYVEDATTLDCHIIYSKVAVPAAAAQTPTP